MWRRWSSISKDARWRWADCHPESHPWVTIPAEADKVVLFESWLRHKVPANLLKAERISIT